MVVMIGRKVFALRGVQNKNTAEHSFEIDVPDFDKIRHLVGGKIKKHGYNTLVTSMRLYILSSHFSKKTSKKLYAKAKNKLSRKRNHPVGDLGEQKGASGFLKRISEYKGKIRNIKHRIKEEENLE